MFNIAVIKYLCKVYFFIVGFAFWLNAVSISIAIILNTDIIFF